MTTHHPRRFPVILITGTPGTGKSLHALLLALQHEPESGPSGRSGPSSSSSSGGDDPAPTPLVHLDIGKLVKEKGFHSGWDDEWQSWTVDEDRLLDYLEEVVNPREGAAGSGFILDHHDPALFPERWIDLAVVLTCDNRVLHERLTARNYPPNKLEENITAEIMMTCLTETRESYVEEIVVELRSDGVGDDVEENVRRISEWMGTWVEERRGERGGVNGEGDERA